MLYLLEYSRLLARIRSINVEVKSSASITYTYIYCTYYLSAMHLGVNHELMSCSLPHSQ